MQHRQIFRLTNHSLNSMQATHQTTTKSNLTNNQKIHRISQKSQRNQTRQKHAQQQRHVYQDNFLSNTHRIHTTKLSNFWKHGITDAKGKLRVDIARRRLARQVHSIISPRLKVGIISLNLICKMRISSSRVTAVSVALASTTYPLASRVRSRAHITLSRIIGSFQVG